MRLVYAAIFYAYFPWFFGLLVFGFLTYLAVKRFRYLEARREQRELERSNYEAELRWRADYQNQWVEAGDPLGTYGDYEPSTLPLTQPMLNPYQLFGGQG